MIIHAAHSIHESGVIKQQLKERTPLTCTTRYPYCYYKEATIIQYCSSTNYRIIQRKELRIAEFF